jgi:hypothetical protein
MKQHSTYLASLFTPPAVIVNISAMLGQNVNFVLVVIISVLTSVFWCISIKNKRLEQKKTQLEIDILEKQKQELK